MERRRTVVVGSLRFQIEPDRSNLHSPSLFPFVLLGFFSSVFPFVLAVNILKEKKRMQSHTVCMNNANLLLDLKN